MELTTVRLRGILGRKFGPVRRLAVETPGEAIRALCAVVPGFETYLRTTKYHFKILIKKSPITIEEEFIMPCGKEISIVPVVRGSKSDGVEFLEGAALIAIAVMLAPGTIACIIGGIGVSLALGGIVQMLSPSPTTNQPSYDFSSIQNTSAQGIPIPVLYGQYRITSPLISEEIDTEMFSTNAFNNGYDGAGTWTGNGSTIPWGASIADSVNSIIN
jgi:predicted phage tail protein